MKTLLKLCNITIKIKINLLVRKMAKNKGTRVLITLECLDCRLNNNKRSQGVSRYITQKNRRNTPNRIELKKYCSNCNIQTIHKEIK